NAVLAGVDLHGVVLHPAGMGVMLGKLFLGQADDVLLPVKQDAPAAGGALVQGDDILFHGKASFCCGRAAVPTCPRRAGCWWIPPPRPPAWRPSPRPCSGSGRRRSPGW